MDGAIAKAPLGGKKTGPNPTHRTKRGVKRSLLTEATGVPIGLAVDGANRHDCKRVEATLESIPVQRPKPTEEEPQGMCLDKGCDYDFVRDLVKAFGYTAHIRARGEEAQAIKREAGFKARRWVVERTHRLDEPLPPHPDALGEESRKRFGTPSPGLLRDHVSLRRIIRIGS